MPPSPPPRSLPQNRTCVLLYVAGSRVVEPPKQHRRITGLAGRDHGDQREPVAVEELTEDFRPVRPFRPDTSDVTRTCIRPVDDLPAAFLKTIRGKVSDCS